MTRERFRPHPQLLSLRASIMAALLFLALAAATWIVALVGGPGAASWQLEPQLAVSGTSREPDAARAVGGEAGDLAARIEATVARRRRCRATSAAAARSPLVAGSLEAPPIYASFDVRNTSQTHAFWERRVRASAAADLLDEGAELGVQLAALFERRAQEMAHLGACASAPAANFSSHRGALRVVTSAGAALCIPFATKCFRGQGRPNTPPPPREAPHRVLLLIGRCLAKSMPTLVQNVLCEGNASTCGSRHGPAFVVVRVRTETSVGKSSSKEGDAEDEEARCLQALLQTPTVLSLTDVRLHDMPATQAALEQILGGPQGAGVLTSSSRRSSPIKTLLQSLMRFAAGSALHAIASANGWVLERTLVILTRPDLHFWEPVHIRIESSEGGGWVAALRAPTAAYFASIHHERNLRHPSALGPHLGLWNEAVPVAADERGASRGVKGRAPRLLLSLPCWSSLRDLRSFGDVLNIGSAAAMLPLLAQFPHFARRRVFPLLPRRRGQRQSNDDTEGVKRLLHVHENFLGAHVRALVLGGVIAPVFASVPVSLLRREDGHDGATWNAKVMSSAVVDRAFCQPFLPYSTFLGAGGATSRSVVLREFTILASDPCAFNTHRVLLQPPLPRSEASRFAGLPLPLCPTLPGTGAGGLCDGHCAIIDLASDAPEGRGVCLAAAEARSTSDVFALLAKFRRVPGSQLLDCVGCREAASDIGKALRDVDNGFPQLHSYRHRKH